MSRAVCALPRAEVRKSAGLRDKTKNLNLCSVIAGLSSGVHEGGDRVVAAGSIAQGAASGVGSV